jgi:hypothetical protein
MACLKDASTLKANLSDGYRKHHSNKFMTKLWHCRWF